MLSPEFAHKYSAAAPRTAMTRGKAGFRGSARGRSLASLSSSGLGDSFYSWRGISGRRYVFSVFAAPEIDMIAGFSAAAIIGVARDGGTRRALCVASSSDFGRVYAAAALAKAAIAEWHVLFAAEENVVDDLSEALLR
jgi:hypothetical protein